LDPWYTLLNTSLNRLKLASSAQWVGSVDVQSEVKVCRPTADLTGHTTV
jgi:hypothetical protein